MCHMSGITGAVFASWGMCFPDPLSLNIYAATPRHLAVKS